MINERDIQLMNKVDQGEIGLAVDVIIVPVPPLNKDINQTPNGKKMGKRKRGAEQGQNILGPNPLKASG